MPLSEITTVNQLKRNLNMGPGYGGYFEILNAINLSAEELNPFRSWLDNRYTRNCISSCEDYELLLLCWQQNQSSPIHSYNSQESWIKVIEGELTVESYEVDRESKLATLKESILIKEGECTYLNDSIGFHKVINTHKGKTQSLHLNALKVEKWEVLRSCREEIIEVSPRVDLTNDDCD